MNITLIGITLSIDSLVLGLVLGLILGLIISWLILGRKKRIKKLLDVEAQIETAYHGLEETAKALRDFHDIIMEADKEMRKNG